MKRFTLRRLLYDERGQSLLEFALLVPVLFILVCGLIDFGQLLYAYLHLNMAVQEAVRIGGLGGSNEEIIQFLHTYVRTDASALNITITPEPAYRESGNYITVALKQQVSYLTPVISGLMDDPIITVDSTIRIE